MISIRLANTSDNSRLLELTELTPMNGRISIRTDRRLDFFQLLHLRGPHTVLIAEEGNAILGSVSVCAIDATINGKYEKVHYLGDLKIHPDYRKTNIAYRLIRDILAHYISINAEYVYCNIAYGNEDVMPFFNGRAGFPTFQNLGVFKVYEIVPSSKRKLKNQYDISEFENVQYLRETYLNHLKRYKLAFVPGMLHLKRGTHFVARKNGNIKASISLFDPIESKQNVIIKLPFILKRFVDILRFLNRIVPRINLPKYNQAIKILYVTYFSYDEEHENALKSLISYANNFAYSNGYNFVSIGLHENDPANRIISAYRKFLFKSIGLFTRIGENSSSAPSLTEGMVYEDFSLV